MVKNKKQNKKGQVTVFIIIALVIVFILIILFIKTDVLTIITGKTPVEQIKDCSEDYTKEAVGILSLQGGSISPENYYLYQGNKLEYLCYTEEDYKTCVMQKPLLKQSIETDIENYISSRVKSCMNSVKSDLEKQGYSVNLGNINPNVELIPSSILIDVQSALTITKEATESYKSIKTDVPSKLYDLVILASLIANSEAHYGDSETMNYMLYNPSLKVEKKKQGEGSTIYILTDMDTEDKFMFASRSLVIPAGLTGE